MRTLAIVVTAVACGTSSLGAQNAHRFEFGGFASFTRYDRAFNLSNQAGGGGRIGYFFTDVLGAELDAGYQAPSAKSGPSPSSVLFGSASLVLNVASEHQIFYLLGGYSRFDWEDAWPYRFTDNGAHAAIGDRILLGDRGALRVEVRGIYAPSTGFPNGSDWAAHLVGTLGLSVLTTVRQADEDRDGVPDRRDACPHTPLGATVDARGCPSDSDKDGVYDGIDRCPNTPAGARVDATGCPSDYDKDGVYDGIDRCPDTPAGASVDATGCPTDSDKDGVYDGIDRCPNTPAGAVVDAVGCPLDGDKDGVPDGIDKCPNTPPGMEVDSVGCQRFKDSDGDGVDDTKDKCPGTPPGSRVDAVGCVILFTPERAPVILRGVNFETGKSILKPESYTVLDIVAGSLLANPDVRIEIAGYCDNRGGVAFNQRLSQARAERVRAYLVTKGVAPSRMTAKGYGIRDPIAPNTTPEGRAQNRRVELHRLP